MVCHGTDVAGQASKPLLLELVEDYIGITLQRIVVQTVCKCLYSNCIDLKQLLSSADSPSIRFSCVFHVITIIIMQSYS